MSIALIINDFVKDIFMKQLSFLIALGLLLGGCANMSSNNDNDDDQIYSNSGHQVNNPMNGSMRASSPD